MPKVLVLSYYWPPAGGPGAIRIVKFVKYLARLDWQALVVTVKNGEFPYRDLNLAEEIPPNCRVYRTRHPDPFSLYKKFSGKNKKETLPTGLVTQSGKSQKEKISAWIRAQFFVPDARIGWLPFALQKTLQIIKKNDIDIIFISSPPHSIQLLGPLLKKLTSCPIVADLRDPWTEIRYYKTIQRSKPTKFLDRFYERKVLLLADRVITVSKGLAGRFCELAGRNINISVISNGYDPDDFGNTAKKKTPYFSLLYSGNMLENQNPQVLWEALEAIGREKSDFFKFCKLSFVGRIPDNVKNILERLSIEYSLHNFMPHKDVIQKFVRAEILIVVVPRVADNKGIVTSKLYEYIGSGNPILVIGPETGDAAETIREISNSCICDYENMEKCKRFILEIYQKWRKGTPYIESRAKSKYSRLELTKKLAHIFKELFT